jgi:hypothetical protein
VHDRTDDLPRLPLQIIENKHDAGVCGSSVDEQP